jgi:hypothetical protein
MMKQATLDILDSELRRDYQRYQSMNYDDKYKLFSHHIYIDPLKSQTYYTDIVNHNLSWLGPIKYCSLPNLDNIITEDKSGIYFFVVKPDLLILEMPQFVVYVGISGANQSFRPLRERLKDYFYFDKIKKRSNIHKMLQLYYENIYIYYAYFNNNVNVSDIETALHEYFSPHFAKSAFDVETRNAVSAWN